MSFFLLVLLSERFRFLVAGTDRDFPEPERRGWGGWVDVKSKIKQNSRVKTY